MAPLEQAVFAQAPQDDLQLGLVDLHSEARADDRKRGMVGVVFGQIIAEEGAVGTAARDCELAREVLEKPITSILK